MPGDWLLTFIEVSEGVTVNVTLFVSPDGRVMVTLTVPDVPFWKMVNELAERLSPISVGGGADVPPPPPQPGRNETELMIKARRRVWMRSDMAGPLVNVERRVTS
ncbi:hypothetical protein SBA2_320010 [Acidobacteriia bacterium SbA2]|nr:hypothetical protein SBA2_320010 [Acidobacteriia bacterium SbA2]